MKPNAYDNAMRMMEYDRICAMLADCAATEGAQAMARRLVPDYDIDRIRTRLKQTSDAKALMILKGYPAFGRVRDIEDAMERAEKSAVLSMRELLDIAAVLTAARRLIDYYNEKRREDQTDSLRVIVSRLNPDKRLEDKITRAILGEDLIADEASPALSDIRRKMRGCHAKIKEILQQYVSGARSRELQDNIVTMRGGRYVIPVKAEYKNEVKGLIHDTSASGATVFIEPMSVVNENNELRTLESREQHEIERILAELSADCAAVSGIILSDYRAVTELAFIFAKAELSNRMDGSEPQMSERRFLSLRRARHPLIDKHKVVATNIQLGGKNYDTMVITGPNTGGKTVTLKTIGLFALMAQSGLHIPCEPDSEMCIFDRILADIGDEQSIEQSLSTFSSHMVKIVDICETVNDRSLVLLDELGAGTDPTEGAALAIAVIERVRARGALCAATTHYAELKAYALETEGVINAGCEFDVETLRPTYRLIVGAPGKSNAFAISLKLGLPEEIIEAAKERISDDNRRFEQVIEQLEKNRIEMERAKQDAEQMRREYEAYRDTELAKLQAKIAAAEKELGQTRDKAMRIMESARYSADYVMAELEQVKKKQESANFAKELAEARLNIRRSLREADDKVNPVHEKTDDDYVLPRPLQKGDTVQLINVGAEGVIIEGPDKKGNVVVRTGMIQTRTNVKNLKLVSEAVQLLDADRKRISAARIQSTIAQTFKPSIDLRGELGDDAWFMTDKYLDEAKMAGVHTVTIIHGKGTGALRAAIQSRLGRDSRVKSFRGGTWGEGDAGVTVVELK